MIGKKTRGVISFIVAVIIGYFLLLLVFTGWPIVRNRVPDFRKLDFVSIDISYSTDRYVITPEKHPWLVRGLLVSMKYLPPPILSGISGGVRWNRLVFHLKDGAEITCSFRWGLGFDELYWDFNLPTREILKKIKNESIGLNEGWAQPPAPERIIFQDAGEKILVTDVNFQKIIFEFVKKVALKAIALEEKKVDTVQIENDLKGSSEQFYIDLFFSCPVTISTEYNAKNGKYKNLITDEVIVIIPQVKNMRDMSIFFHNPSEGSYFYGKTWWGTGLNLNLEKDEKWFAEIINIFNSLKNKPTAEIKGFERNQ